MAVLPRRCATLIGLGLCRIRRLSTIHMIALPALDPRQPRPPIWLNQVQSSQPHEPHETSLTTRLCPPGLRNRTDGRSNEPKNHSKLFPRFSLLATPSYRYAI